MRSDLLHHICDNYGIMIRLFEDEGCLIAGKGRDRNGGIYRLAVREGIGSIFLVLSIPALSDLLKKSSKGLGSKTSRQLKEV